MRRGRVFCGIMVAAVLVSGRSLEAGSIWKDAIISGRIVRVSISGAEGIISLVGRASGLPLSADGGGDGGDGGGSGDGSGSSDTGSSGDGSDTGASTDGDSASTDGPSADAADGLAAAPATNVAVAPMDPTDPTPTVTPEMNAIMSIPTTDPRGTDVAAPTTTTGNTPGDTADDVPGAGEPCGATPAPPVDVGIHAVIVSGAMSPWDAIGKVPGVDTVTVTGGIVALGTTPLPGEPQGGGPQPPWLRLVPDLKLLNGSVIPPVVPNVIDVRITRNTIEAVEKPNN